MDHNSVQPAEKSPGQSVAGKTPRLFFIDHLRAALVILVILHHVAIVYGEGVTFYYVEPPNRDTLTYLILVVFILVNQAWFMGALFLLAGYFTPGSYERKGPGSFLKDRLLRLGIPIIIWIFVLNPISSIGLYLEPDPRITDPLTWQAYPYLLRLGPLWFVAMLLIFSSGYGAWRMLTRNQTLSSMSKSPLPSYLDIGIFILALALGSYLIRIIVPIGQIFTLFVDVLRFPSIAYILQYLSFFVLGIVAYRNNWLRALPTSMGVAGFVIAVVTFVLLFPLALFGSPDRQFMGNGSWQSAVYALWDSIFAVGMCLGMITLFRRFFNGQGRFGRFLSQHSYTVYIIHSPIIVFVAVALQGIDLENFLKFGLVTVIVVPTSFAVAYIIRRIPLVSRIL